MNMHKVQNSFQRLLAAENTINVRLEILREEIGRAIRDAQVPGVKPIPGSVNCCAVSFSAIANSKNLCLTPEYYLQESQTKAVDSVLVKRQTASSFLAALSDMIHNGCAKVGNSKTPLNDQTLDVLREIFNNLNV